MSAPAVPEFRPLGTRQVFRQRSTGDLYVVRDGVLGIAVSLNGEGSYLLEPVHRLINPLDGSSAQDSRPADAGTPYALLNEKMALSLQVSRVEFERDFDKATEYRARQNSDIHELLRSYEEEECDHSNLEWVVNSALRYSFTMPDSQARCLLYVLAQHAQNTLPTPSDLPLVK